MGRRATVASTCLVLAFAELVAGRASAAPSAGEQLFREGRLAMQNNDYEEACAKFAESQRLEPAPGTALNLGECEERRGHFVAASQAFSVAAAASTGDKQKYASSRAASVDKKICHLTIRASAGVPPDLVLSISKGPAKEVTSLDTEIKLDPGDVIVHAEAPKHRAKDLTVTLREGKTVELDLGSLEPITPESAPLTVALPTTKPTKSPLPTIGLIVGGVGAASLIVGGVTGVLALDRASTVKDHCNDDLACDAEGVNAADSGSTLSLVSTITVVAGAAGIAAGGLLYYIGRQSRAPGAAIRVIPKAAPGTAGLTILGRF